MDVNKTWFILLGVMKPKCPLFVQRRMRKWEGTHFECVCLQEVEITFLEGLRKENAANQIKKKSQVMWEFRVEWERESAYKRKMW